MSDLLASGAYMYGSRYLRFTALQKTVLIVVLNTMFNTDMVSIGPDIYKSTMVSCPV